MLFLIENFAHGESQGHRFENTSINKLRERFSNLYPNKEQEPHMFGGFSIKDKAGRTLVLVTNPALTSDKV